VRFEVSDEELENIRRETLEKGQIDWVRAVQIFDLHGKVVADVEKTLYIATKEHYRNRKQRE
jgi:hypothetical protein